MKDRDNYTRFTNREYAILCAEILERMTGDKCIVQVVVSSFNYVWRDAGCGKMVVV